MTHIKLMIDYNFGKPVAEALETIGAVRASTTIDEGLEQGADDDKIIVHAVKKNAILLTHDKSTINQRTFPPCNHNGIIIIRESKWTVEKVYEMVRKLCLSGYKSEAVHNVMHLFPDKAVVYKHEDEKLQLNL